MAKKVYVGGSATIQANGLPLGYTEVSFIKTNGNQHFDTELALSRELQAGLRIVADIEIITTSGAWCVNGHGANLPFLYFGISNNAYYAYGNGAEDIQSTTPYSQGRYTWDLNIPEKKLTVSSGFSVQNIAFTTSNGSSDTFIISGYGTGNDVSCHPEIIHSYKFYLNGSLVRDYVTCKKASGVAGLYDKVEGLFYEPKGNGTLTVGAEVATETYKVDNVACEVKQIHIGINSVARQVNKGYVGVNGIARQFWQSSIPIGEIAVGTTVWMNVNGTAREFIVVNQGLPSSLYDSSCNGTWLLMKDIYTKKAWDATNNDYENSDVHAYLNGTFLNLFDAKIQSHIKQVKIPYHKGIGYSGSVYSGANGLSTKIFLLSGYEVGWTTATNPNSLYLPVDGACLDYFEGAGVTDSKRIGYYNNTATNWWLRSPSTSHSDSINNVSTNGYWGTNYLTYSLGVRPALILPSDTLVTVDMNVIV